MTTLIAIYLYGLAAFLVILMLRQYHSGTHDLLSIRNVALVGFILFQLTSGATVLYTDGFGQFYVEDQVWVGLEFAAMSTLFLIVAFWAYRRGWFVIRTARRLPSPKWAPSDSTLVTMAVVLTVMGVALKFGVRIPLVGAIASYLGIGCASIAVGLVAWIWSRRMLNVGFLLLTAIILGLNFLTAITGSFGRRDLVAVGAALLWGMYFCSWRYLPTGAVLRRLVLFGTVPVLVLATFSTVRGIGREHRSVTDQLQKMIQFGDVREGLADLIRGQGCGGISMWLIETHPETFEHRHMFTPFYLVVLPIPRDLWASKPAPIGALLPQMARMSGINRKGASVGPGIIGNAACEGGWYAVIVYAVMSGLFLRFFDEIIQINVHSPLIVMASGSSLGQAIGFARGETSLFAFIFVNTVVGTLIMMILLGRYLESRRPAWSYDQYHEGEPSADDWEDAEPEDIEHAAEMDAR